MAEWIKALVLRVTMLPAEPHVPDGSAGSTQVFRAGRNFLRWSMIIWAFAQAGILVSAIAFGIAIETLMFRLPGWAQTGVRLLEWIAVVTLAAIWVFTWFQLRLNYELRWYIVTDRSLRIRSGIFTVQELTMTFANIQEIRVTSTSTSGLPRSRRRGGPLGRRRRQGAWASEEAMSADSRASTTPMPSATS